MPEAAHGVAVEPATAEVPARGAALGRVEHQLLVEVDRGAHRLDQPGTPATVLGDGLVVVAQRDAGTRREPLDRVDEVEVLDLAHERDRVAGRPAAEAVVRGRSPG